jgi:hypothetical protein
MEFGRKHFLARLRAEFPEVIAQITQYDEGLLHCEVAVFRRATESAIDAGHMWRAENHFRLVEELLTAADPDLRNALEISYLADFAFGECTPARHRAVKERMPRAMRTVLIQHHEQWQ